MKTLLLCSLAILLTAGSCKKSAEKQLPPATQTGANTFGCLINGKPLIANRKPPKGMSGLLDGTIQYSINLSYPGVSIDAIAGNNKVHPDNVKIRIPQFNGIGKYSGENVLFWETQPIPNSDSYIEVLKYENGILSGIFQAYIMLSANERVEITNGRFDISK